MEVIIKERSYTYDSDFPEGWQFSKGDYFKFPVEIGIYKCFIKRFKIKRPENISGWELMTNLKGKFAANLPRIHDIVCTPEMGSDIYYIFYEFIDGETLNQLNKKHIEVNFLKLTDDLFSALQSLHRHNYWFADFDDKNIFCNKRGTFYLIDVDSTQPLSLAPDTDMWGSKDYWVLVFDFYKKVLGHQDFIPSQLNGIALNYLHVLFLVLRLKIYYVDKERDYNEHFNQLPFYLDKISPSFRELFSEVFENQASPLQFNAKVKNLVKEKIIPLTEATIKTITGGGAAPVAEPAIREFTVINPLEKNGHQYVVAKGAGFTLRWEVENASNVEVYEDEVMLEQFTKGENSMQIESTSPGKTSIRYKLLASEGPLEVTSHPLTISLQDVAPVIAEFGAADYDKKEGNVYVVKSGKPFTLNWQTQNGARVELHKDGQLYKDLGTSAKSIRLSDEPNDDDTIEYQLVVFNSSGEVRSEPLFIRVLNPEPAILEFTATGYLRKTGDEYIIENGKALTLSWNVNNAGTVDLFRNGEIHKSFTAGKNSLEVTEQVYDGKDKTVEYWIDASNGTAEPKRRVIKVRVVRATPVIKSFAVNKNKVNNNKPFVLKWEVRNASGIKLYKDGELFRNLDIADQEIELSEETYDEKKKTVEFRLLALNGPEEVQSDPVIITILPDVAVVEGTGQRKYLRVAGIALIALLLLLILAKFIFNRSPAKRLVEGIEPRILYADSTIDVYGKLPDSNRISVMFDTNRAEIKSFSKDHLVAIVPALDDPPNPDNVTVRVLDNGKELYSVQSHYVAKPQPSVVNLPEQLNDIWYDGTGKRFLSISFRDGVIYSSGADKNNFIVDSIKQVQYDNKGAAYHIITRTQKGYRMWLLKNPVAQSFQIADCSMFYPRQGDVQQAGCSSFTTMSEFYDNNPKAIYLPVTNKTAGLDISQKNKLDKIVKSGANNGFTVDVVVANRFIEAPDLNTLSGLLQTEGISNPPVKKNSLTLSDNNPFQRNYLAIAPLPNTNTNTTATNNNIPDCSKTYTSIAQVRSTPLVVCKLDLSRPRLSAIPAEIYKFTNLKVLNLGRNTISEDEIAKVKRALPQCNVLSSFITEPPPPVVVDNPPSSKKIYYIEFDNDHELTEASRETIRNLAQQLQNNPGAKLEFRSNWNAGQHEDDKQLAANITSFKNDFKRYGVKLASDQLDVKLTAYKKLQKNLNRFQITWIDPPKNKTEQAY